MIEIPDIAIDRNVSDVVAACIITSQHQIRDVAVIDKGSCDRQNRPVGVVIGQILGIDRNSGLRRTEFNSTQHTCSAQVNRHGALKAVLEADFIDFVPAVQNNRVIGGRHGLKRHLSTLITASGILDRLRRCYIEVVIRSSHGLRRDVPIPIINNTMRIPVLRVKVGQIHPFQPVAAVPPGIVVGIIAACRRRAGEGGGINRRLVGL